MPTKAGMPRRRVLVASTRQNCSELWSPCVDPLHCLRASGRSCGDHTLQSAVARRPQAPGRTHGFCGEFLLWSSCRASAEAERQRVAEKRHAPVTPGPAVPRCGEATSSSTCLFRSPSLAVSRGNPRREPGRRVSSRDGGASRSGRGRPPDIPRVHLRRGHGKACR